MTVASGARPSGVQRGHGALALDRPGLPDAARGRRRHRRQRGRLLRATPNPAQQRNVSVTEPPARDANGDDRQQSPRHSTNSTAPRSPTTRRRSTGATFECKLDVGAFAACDREPDQLFRTPGRGQPHVPGPGPQRQRHRPGRRATPGPSTSRLPTVDDRQPPADPSSGRQCRPSPTSSASGERLDLPMQPRASGRRPDSFSACPSAGKTYSNLADGDLHLQGPRHRPGRQPELAAADHRSRRDLPWTVDNSLADTTPPETTIDTKPPDPSSSSTASFTYQSNEPGSTFQCKLDGAAFASCAPSGVTYTGLANGSHTFQVRATDPSNNVDPTPPATRSASCCRAPLRLRRPPSPPTLPLSPPDDDRPQATGQDPRPHPDLPLPLERAGVDFRCKVDGGAFKACRSPFTTKTLTPSAGTP